jgi:hypothetical protein
VAVLADVLHVRAADAAFNGVTEALVRALLPCVLLACATGGPCLYCLEWKEWGHLLVCRVGCPLMLERTRNGRCVTPLLRGCQRPRPLQQRTRPTATVLSLEEENNTSSTIMMLLTDPGDADDANAGCCCAL